MMPLSHIKFPGSQHQLARVGGNTHLLACFETFLPLLESQKVGIQRLHKFAVIGKLLSITYKQSLLRTWDKEPGHKKMKCASERGRDIYK